MDETLTSGEVLSHFLVAGFPVSAFRLDPPIWSLIIEIRASLLFPLLFILVVRLNWISLIFAIFLAFAATKAGFMLGETQSVSSKSLSGTIFLTIRYLPYFIIGILCALKTEYIGKYLTKIPNACHVMTIPLFILSAFVVARGHLYNHAYTDLFYGAFAAYLIVCAVIYDGMTRVLMHPWSAWLGKVSFSLYIIHWPILLLAYYVMTDFSPAIVIITALPCILIAAAIMERWVERPSHNWGKRLARRLEYR